MRNAAGRLRLRCRRPCRAIGALGLLVAGLVWNAGAEVQVTSEAGVDD
jgi:hypothetical protein